MSPGFVKFSKAFYCFFLHLSNQISFLLLVLLSKMHFFKHEIDLVKFVNLSSLHLNGIVLTLCNVVNCSFQLVGHLLLDMCLVVPLDLFVNDFEGIIFLLSNRVRTSSRPGNSSSSHFEAFISFLLSSGLSIADYLIETSNFLSQSASSMRSVLLGSVNSSRSGQLRDGISSRFGFSCLKNNLSLNVMILMVMTSMSLIR